MKTLDKVLVRNGQNMRWHLATFVCNETSQEGETLYVCELGAKFKECIPYNELTAHLLETKKPYEQKVWQIMSSGYNDILTDNELSKFMQTAVINNKDVTDFRIRYINQ